MNKSSLFITLTLAMLTISVWALLNRPGEAPAWPERIQGFCFSPMHAGQNPIEKRFPSVEQIDADLALLAGKSHAIRTYSTEDVLGRIPELARKHGINVALGAWLDADVDTNEREVERVIEIAGANFANVLRIIVGNEVLLRGELSVEELTAYLDRVRAAVVRPVSTAEPPHIWLKHPELADHVDFLTVHLLPYWEGVDVQVAVDYAVGRLAEVQQRFPDKPIVIGEVGWPSHGRTRQAAVASDANQATFLRHFLARAEQERYTYYVMEAFDQPWKRHTMEGAVGAYWGVWNVAREPKFPFAEPIVAVPNWQVLAGVAVVIASLALALIFLHSGTLRGRGRSFIAVVAFAATTVAVWIVYDYLQQYLTPSGIVVGVLMLLGIVGVSVILLTEAHEWAEAVWVSERRRALRPRVLADEALPMVSIHVPTYNEPPDMVIDTLNALARLDYPRFEVLLIDNNTKDPAVWQPVQAHCARLGSRFRFFHVDDLAGFKAGALNFALDRTHPEAEIVAVIDSDYTVTPDWLRDLVPQFTDPQTAVVQAPQDYRDGDDNAFKAMCYAEYQGFFAVGMVTRNERNAIIQHGTMTLVRRAVLEEVGRWGEWCITEDAELGLRIFEHGYQAAYTPRSYGRGLMPDNFPDYKKQRFRWAYGAVQIMKRHLGTLLGRGPSELTHGQRYHFIAGWLPWLADGANLLFNLAALYWSVAMVVAPDHVDPPLLMFAVLPLSFVCFKVAKAIYLYRTRLQASLVRTAAATVAGLALSHTIAKAVLSAFVTNNKPFFRTPKHANAQALLQALGAAREEVLLLVGLLVAAGGIAYRQDMGAPDTLIWVVVLIVQAVPYLAALVVSLLASLPGLPARRLGVLPAAMQHGTGGDTPR